MTESAVHLYGEIPLTVAEGDIRTHHGFGRGLSADIFIVGHIIVQRAVIIFHQTVAMGQIEHAQGLTNDLHHHVGCTMETWSPKRRDARHCGSSEVLTVVVTVEREQLVALKAPVHVDGQVHILGTKRRNTEANLQTAVLHGTHIGQELVVGERRYGHIIDIEHVGGLGMVVINGEGYTTVP